MDGLSLKIKTNDGVDSVFSLRPRTIVAFEQKFGKGLAKLFAEDGTHLLPRLAIFER